MLATKLCPCYKNQKHKKKLNFERKEKSHVQDFLKILSESMKKFLFKILQ